MDPDSARLALDLQLQDVDDSLRTLNTENEAAAFRVLRDELIKKKGEIDGQCAAMGLLRNEFGERSVHRRLLAEERQAQGDHGMASRLAGRAPVPQLALPVNRPPDEPLNGNVAESLSIDLGLAQTEYAVPGNPRKHRAEEDNETLREKTEGCVNRRRVAATKERRSNDENDATPEKVTLSPSLVDDQVRSDGKEELEASATEKAPQEIANRTPCSGCFEEFGETDIIKLPCPTEEDALKHAYCQNCLRSIFAYAIADSDHFPPRCCEPLEVSHCTRLLSDDLVSKFKDKKEEMDTPHRVYCSKAECAKWIKPLNIEAGVAACSECSQKTCANCKAKQHDGLCPDDADVQALLTLAKEKQWKSCPECKTMVELTMGCYHIT
ncbi:uncharacterized protein N0V89_011585 [Didymosphaeria variabile]|uniref:RBR-type E3 ubiquitin transferase n=1 Tax=Didymosphaeria variabile TaxID=1932322 RepID=A0A9W9C5V8_9PLEO|nr:uncharacterized protein N0V89_011585 [Didymosphaeria variabile]KAJ4345454.1 hypothetical protein N0V89_011585 [Didymosphaeria variabile]